MTEFYDRYWMGQAGVRLSDFDRKWPVLAPMIPTRPGTVILDYGCGNGEVLVEVRRINNDAICVGADVSETALSAAKSRLPDVTFYHVRDGGKVPLDSEAVDFILCSEVIEHVYDTESTFAELARVLRRGGALLLTTPYHGVIKNLFLALVAFDRHFDPTGPHIRFFTKRSLFACLRKARLEPKSHGYIGRVYPVSMAIYVLAEKL